MPEPLEDRKTLLQLLPIVERRVNDHLSHWPIVHREDVVQDAVVKLVALFNDAERVATIANIDAYAERVIGNAIIDAIRAYAKQRKMLLLAHEVAFDMSDCAADCAIDCDPANLAADAELATGVTLTPKQKRLLDLCKELGSSVEVAKALGIPIQTACERISRLIAVLRKQVYGRAA